LTLRQQLTDAGMDPTERRCLTHFLHVRDNMRPQLIQCYDLPSLPRTHNDMEGFIRAIKTRYRRISGRKNWNRENVALWAAGGLLRSLGATAPWHAGQRCAGPAGAACPLADGPSGAAAV